MSSVQLEIVTIKCRGCVAREVGERFVVVDCGTQLVSLSDREIALEVEDKASCTQPHLQALLFRLQLFLSPNSGRSGSFDPFEVRLDTANCFSHPNDDLLANIHESGFSVLCLQLPFVIGAPG